MKYLLALAVLLTATTANAWWAPNCSNGELKHQPRVGQTDQYRCKIVQSTPATCRAGETPRVRANAKDQCQSGGGQSAQYRAVTCKLKAGDKRSNWVIQRQNGADTCNNPNKPNKGLRPVKCANNQTLRIDSQGNRDRCEVGQSAQLQVRDMSCPANSIHRVNGADRCETQTFARPRF